MCKTVSIHKNVQSVSVSCLSEGIHCGWEENKPQSWLGGSIYGHSITFIADSILKLSFTCLWKRKRILMLSMLLKHCCFRDLNQPTLTKTNLVESTDYTSEYGSDSVLIEFRPSGHSWLTAVKHSPRVSGNQFCVPTVHPPLCPIDNTGKPLPNFWDSISGFSEELTNAMLQTVYS